MVCSRSGPTETIVTGRPSSSPIREDNGFACCGRAAYDRHHRQVFLPAGQRLVHGHGLFEVVGMAGEMRHPAAIDLIGGANLQFVEAAEHVEEHHGQLIHARQPAV